MKRAHDEQQATAPAVDARAVSSLDAEALLKLEFLAIVRTLFERQRRLPSVGEYMAYCLEEGRAPLTNAEIDERFGAWHRALIAAGLLPRELETLQPMTAPPTLLEASRLVAEQRRLSQLRDEAAALHGFLSGLGLGARYRFTVVVAEDEGFDALLVPKTREDATLLERMPASFGGRPVRYLAAPAGTLELVERLERELADLDAAAPARERP